MQQELIEMLEEIIQYVEVWRAQDQEVIDKAEALIEKAKNSAKEPAVPQGWQVERKSDYRIRVQSPSGEAWSFEHVDDRGSANLFVYQMLDAMLAAAPAAPSSAPLR